MTRVKGRPISHSTAVVPRHDQTESPATGVTFVVPVHNGLCWLREVLASIDAQRDGRPFEIIAVDDGSDDGSRELLEEYKAAGALRLIDAPHGGAAAAINAGIRHAAHPLIAQVDQDVILRPGWLAVLASELDDPEVAAAQGQYVTASAAGFWARMSGRDLEQRYRRIRSRYVDHVCTGNSVYRATALHQVGFLDESMGYGYDNDLSYRLAAAGYRLVFNRTAISVHRWREDLAGYLRQQFGVGYGRLDVLHRHQRRIRGDNVSGALMMMHGPMMLLSIVLLLIAIVMSFAGVGASIPTFFALTLICFLFAERTTAGLRASIVMRDIRTVGFGPAHLLRDVAWAAAIVIWCMRRAARHPPHPAESMPRRSIRSSAARPAGGSIDSKSVLAIVPAFNEARTLASVVEDVRQTAPGIEILVVNDGSTDETSDVLPSLNVRWLTLSQRIGIGGAMRTGLRYAIREGYSYVLRIDGDGQHRACDAGALLRALSHRNMDAIIGSRFLERSDGSLTLRRITQSVLASYLTLVTRRRITDPTSGLWAFGPRAVKLLARHHPTGYAEPELILFLCRNGLAIGEVPIRARARAAGRTSLTPSRAAVAFARTVLALMMVPARRTVDRGILD